MPWTLLLFDFCFRYLLFLIGLLQITGRYYSVCLQSYAFYANVARIREKKRGNLCFHTLQQRLPYVTAKILSKIFFTKPVLFFPVCAESFSRHI